MRTQISARDRLLQLPDVFSGPELSTLFQWKSGIASTYLANWRTAGLIKSLGGRSDVHMNLVANPHVNPEAAMRRAFPGACKIGVDILREAGWTTQIPSEPDVAIPSSMTLYGIDGFTLSHRSMRWFQKVAPGIDLAMPALDRLQPAWALADMIARAGDGRVHDAWLLDPEDLDLDAASCDKQMDRALHAFGLSPEVITTDGYAEIYEHLHGRSGREWQRQRLA